MFAGAPLRLTMASFLVLALPPAALSVAWPSAAATLDRTLGDLGVLIAAYAIAYLASTWLSGRVLEWFPVGDVLTFGGWTTALAALTLATAPSWWVLLVSTAILGAAGGAIDTAGNAYVALRMDARAMNLVHAAFGAGSVLGPVVMTPLVADRGLDGWRTGILLVAATAAVLAVALTVARGGWEQIAVAQADEPAPSIPAATLVTGLLVFFLYSGIEVVAGQYSFTLLSEGRSAGTTVAGIGAGGFWLGLTISRLLVGWTGHRFPPAVILRIAGLVSAASFVVLWLATDPLISAGLLVMAGFGLGPFFPLGMSRTPDRVGRERTSRMIGYQIGSANLGAAIIPWTTGMAVDRAGLWAAAAILAIGGLVLPLADATFTAVAGRR